MLLLFKNFKMMKFDFFYSTYISFCVRNFPLHEFIVLLNNAYILIVYHYLFERNNKRIISIKQLIYAHLNMFKQY